MDLQAGVVKWAVADGPGGLERRWRRARRVQGWLPADPVDAVLQVVEHTTPELGSVSLFVPAKTRRLFGRQRRAWARSRGPVAGKVVTVERRKVNEPAAVVLFPNGGLAPVRPLPGPGGVVSSRLPGSRSLGADRVTCSFEQWEQLERVAVWGGDHTKGAVVSRLGLAVAVWDARTRA